MSESKDKKCYYCKKKITKGEVHFNSFKDTDDGRLYCKICFGCTFSDDKNGKTKNDKKHTIETLI